MKTGAASLGVSVKPFIHEHHGMTNYRPSTDRQPLALDTLALPVQLDRVQPSKHRRRWQVLAGLGLLVLLLEGIWLSQNVWLQQGAVRNALNPLLANTEYEWVRPVVANAWQVTDLDWRASASDPHRYQLDARLTHRADILQAWPTLRLSLRDAQGMRISRLDLRPQDYLPKAPPLPALASSDQPLRISLAIQLLPRDNGTWPAYAAIELSPVP